MTGADLCGCATGDGGKDRCWKGVVVRLERLTGVPTAKALDEIVSLHVGAFDGYYLTSLGTGLLRRYYLSLLKEPGSYCFLLMDESDRIFGIALYLRDYEKCMRRFYLTNVVPLAASIIRGMLFEGPLFRKQTMSRLFPRNDSGRDEAEVLPPYTLLCLAVDSNNRGLGWGGKLIEFAEEQLIGDNVKSYYLSVQADNSTAVALYTKLGFDRVLERSGVLEMIKRNHDSR